VGRIEGIGDFGGEFQALLQRHRFSVNAMLERPAFEKLHRDKSTAILLADVVDGADVRMIQGGCGLRFPFEAGQCLRIARNFLRQEFQRHQAMKPRVLRLVHDTHSTTAEFLDDAIIGYRLTNERIGAGHPEHILGCAGNQVNEANAFRRQSRSYLINTFKPLKACELCKLA
jgi:hypothetical protein